MSALPGILGEWALTFLLQSTLLIGAAWLLTRGARREDSVEIAWRMALCGALLGASGRVAAPRAQAFVASRSAAAAERRFEARVNSAAGVLPEPASFVSFGTTVAEPGPRWPTRLLIVWVLGAGALLARSLVAHRRFLHSLSGRTMVCDGPVAACLEDLRRRAGMRRSIRLTRSERCPVPLVIGRAEICLPERFFVDLAPDEQRAVLAHELGHIVRRDPSWQRATFVMQHLLFLQPLVWLVAARLRHSAERLSDAWAARLIGEPLTLAQSLTSVGGWMNEATPAGTALTLAEGGGPLTERVRRLLLPMSAPPPLHWRVVRTGLGLVVVAAIGLSAPRVGVTRSAPNDFTWADRLAANDTLEIKNPTGDVLLEAATGHRGSVHAVASGPDAHTVRFAVLRSGSRITICTVLPPTPGRPPNRCEAGRWRNHGSRAKARVDYVVRVPLDANVELRNMTGELRAAAVPASLDLEAMTGSMALFLPRGGWHGALTARNMSGDITVWAPAGTPLAWTTHSDSGSVNVDAALQHALPAGASAAGRVALESIHGAIAVRRLP